MTLEHRQKHAQILIYVGLIVATLLAYEPIRHNDFVNYDDRAYITENPKVTGGITLQSIIWAFTNSHMGNWHPLTMLSHIADCQLFGLHPLGHHLVSVAIHIVNALLLLWILNSITGSLWPSAFVAAIFALHPLQVESVAWAAERKTVLSGLFWLLTMAAYIHYTKRPGTARYILLFLVYGLCIMTKPVVVTLPFVLLLLDYWPLGRIETTYKGQLITEKIPLLALSVTLSVMTLIAQRDGGAFAYIEKMALDSRIANMFVSYIKYIGKMIWPSRLAVFYPYNLSVATTVICALLFVLITALSIYTGRRGKYIMTGWLWFVGTMVPMMGLIQAGAQAMADRYMYISMLGLLFIVAWAVKDLVASRPRWKVVAAITAVVVLSSATTLTRLQVGRWRSSLTLFDYALKVTENNEVAESNYGSALFEAGRLDEAILHLNKALSITPNIAEARDNLGRIYAKQGKLNEAIACFTELINRKHRTAEVYYNLAIALGKQKRYDEAIKHLAKVLQLNPTYPDAYNKMGFALQLTGRPNEAIKYLNEGLKISKDQETYANLGSAYIQVGKYDLAIQNLTRAAELKSDNTDVLNKLAWLLATVDDASIHNVQKAVEFAQRGCELTGYNDPMLLDTLAVAYAAAGRFDEAKATAEKALNLANKTGLENLAIEIQERIKFYEAGQPYRQK